MWTQHKWFELPVLQKSISNGNEEKADVNPAETSEPVTRCTTKSRQLCCSNSELVRWKTYFQQQYTVCPPIHAHDGVNETNIVNLNIKNSRQCQ